MNKLSEAISAQITSVQPGYDANEFALLCSKLDSAMLSGRVNWPLAKEVLENLLKGQASLSGFPVWKTLMMRRGFAAKIDIEPGLLSEIARYYRDLYPKSGYKIWGFNMMIYEHSYAQQRFEAAFRAGNAELDLVRVTPRQLGFNSHRGVSRSLFYESALLSGLEKCFYEVAIALRLAYTDQPYGEWLTIATDTNVPDYLDRLLRVGRGRKEDPLCVMGVVSDPKTKIGLDHEFVFIKPRALA